MSVAVPKPLRTNWPAPEITLPTVILPAVEKRTVSLTPDQARFNTFERYLVKGVVHAPCGAHPTTCAPEYGWDMGHFKRYVASAAEEGGWQAYMDEFVTPGEAAYQDKNGGIERMGKLPLPVF